MPSKKQRTKMNKEKKINRPPIKRALEGHHIPNGVVGGGMIKVNNEHKKQTALQKQTLLDGAGGLYRTDGTKCAKPENTKLPRTR